MLHSRFAQEICRSRTLRRLIRGYADVGGGGGGGGGFRPVRRAITPEERAALRAARKEQAARTLREQTKEGGASGESRANEGAMVAGPTISANNAKYLFYASVIVPTGLIAWAINDSDSPPARVSNLIGLTGFIRGFTDEISKPSHDKLLPDWNQIPNVPPDIPAPHTLVLDLENTLVSSTWDRKYGWRHAKRPGVDQFLRTLAEYYEIVLYSPSHDSLADPVVTSLDKNGCIMHRLYRDATHYYDGAHVKDLGRLNRNVNRMVVLDDNPEEVQFNPGNLIRIKPYEDPTDRTDRSLERITPFLIEIVRGGYNDVPAVLRQYKGMDADQIAESYQNRIAQYKQNREERSRRGLGGLVSSGRSRLPVPELAPSQDDAVSVPQQLTAKDLVGGSPLTPAGSGGMVGWMNRRSKEKEEQNMRKMEKWNEVMLKKQQHKKEAAAAAAGAI